MFPNIWPPWIGIGTGLAGAIVFFPWKHIFRLSNYIECSISTVRHWPALTLDKNDKKVPSDEAYIIPEILVKNRTGFPLTISKLQGTPHCETQIPIPLSHELLCVKRMKVEPHDENIYKLRLAISKKTAERLVKSKDIGQGLLWHFDLTICAKIWFLPKEYVVQCATPEKPIVPQFDDWEDSNGD